MSEIQIITKDQIEDLFHANYKNLCMVAVRYVDDLDLAKDLVQEFFVYLLNKQEQIQLRTSFEAYAVRSIKFTCITYLKRQKGKIIYQSDNLPETAFDPFGLIEDENLKTETYTKLNTALKNLPTERRKIFLMSNVEGLTYAEIAEINGISVNTVKTQIKKAYATLRTELFAKTLIALILFLKKGN
ncbi:RNA polymerase sigma factor [Solitalea koreensis]|uniref:RNA polymerase sigma-70 factor, ECF subfamily n=1 Tax=Solitalea koreensis TaxID=543615 RepID=A0A521AAR6_9SPHI|nr:RNA polymerase sigma-70 factor [Solitalea koreensis]SMO31820.1 RNA polymerase sigma-70 factor, ECF subfamily [Solitalea koreensis]